MKIYTPDPCTPHRLASMSVGIYYADGAAEAVLIDIGLKRALSGVSFSDFLKFITKVRMRMNASVYYIIVPDVYDKFTETHRNWLKFAPRLKPYGEPVYVAQGFVLPKDWGPVEPALIGLPAHSQNYKSCFREPGFCAANIMRFMAQYDGSVPLHLLGPVKAVLLQLKRWGYLDRIVSFDTASYRRAPNKKAKEMLNGKWQVVKGLECAWFQEWIKGVV
jgi:hypothetical protein